VLPQNAQQTTKLHTHAGITGQNSNSDCQFHTRESRLNKNNGLSKMCILVKANTQKFCKQLENESE